MHTPAQSRAGCARRGGSAGWRLSGGSAAARRRLGGGSDGGSRLALLAMQATAVMSSTQPSMSRDVTNTLLGMQATEPRGAEYGGGFLKGGRNPWWWNKGARAALPLSARRRKHRPFRFFPRRLGRNDASVT